MPDDFKVVLSYMITWRCQTYRPGLSVPGRTTGLRACRQTEPLPVPLRGGGVGERIRSGTCKRSGVAGKRAHHATGLRVSRQTEPLPVPLRRGGVGERSAHNRSWFPEFQIRPRCRRAGRGRLSQATWTRHLTALRARGRPARITVPPSCLQGIRDCGVMACDMACGQRPPHEALRPDGRVTWPAPCVFRGTRQDSQ